MATIHRRTLQEDPKITDTFPKTRYEDDILETEVKDAIKHISNQK